MFFGLFGKKREVAEDEPDMDESVEGAVNDKEDDSDIYISFEPEKVDLKDGAARIAYIDRLKETILEGKKQANDVKFEYGRVTSYLKDIQLIDQALYDDRAVIDEAAAKIVELTEQRKVLQKKKYKITDAQRRSMDNFEGDIPDDVEKLIEYEDYQVKIKNDLRQLGGEKNLLMSDKSDIIRRQSSLKTISKALVIILSVIAVLMGVLMAVYKVDITVPFVATVAFGFVVAALILAEARKNRIDMVITEKKANRAIALTNKVKIKYVNNTKTLDYLCNKYHVRSASELEFVYSQYRQAKREWARQREGTIQIEENHDILIKALRKIGVRDCEIWFSQVNALINPNDMVEVRHDLNTRRGKLREQLDYNIGVMGSCIDELERIRDKKPEYAADVERVIGEIKEIH